MGVVKGFCFAQLKVDLLCDPASSTVDPTNLGVILEQDYLQPARRKAAIAGCCLLTIMISDLAYE